jgi:DNA replication and repair protein RecF
MALTRIEISNLRNIAHATLDPAPRINLLVGDNGSGKTSALEAVYLLGRARSFRTNQTSQLVQFQHSHLLVTGTVGDGTAIGLRMSRAERELHLAGQKLQSSAELVRAFPVLLIHPPSSALLDGAPRLRRQFLDWGVFHVEHHYLDNWRCYAKALSQRNALLRQGRRKELAAWNHQLARYGTIVAEARNAYLQRLQPHLSAATEHFFPGCAVRLEHSLGWKSSRTLMEVLGEEFGPDLTHGYTVSGPHKGDFTIFADDKPAKTYFSRGQAKLMAYALLLAQSSLLEDAATPVCLLVDDLASELDRRNRGKLMGLLAARRGQCFVTAVHPGEIEGMSADATAMFHVEHGRISPT